MFARFLLLFAVIAGLAVGSAPASGLHGARKNCGCCPTGEAMPCCEASHTAPADGTLATTVPTDFKQALTPVLHFLGSCPQIAVGLPSVIRRIAARQPARPRFALLCSRLI